METILGYFWQIALLVMLLSIDYRLHSACSLLRRILSEADACKWVLQDIKRKIEAYAENHPRDFSRDP